MKNGRILVIGDNMIDEHIFCKCERISPEAPVPVGLYEKEEKILGGAANVASQIAVIAPCTLLYIRSNHWIDEDFLTLCDKKNIDVLYLNTDEEYVLPHKQRIWLGGQQSCRVDTELQNVKYSNETVGKWIHNIISHIKGREIKIVVFSDYDKGLLTNEMIQAIVDFCNTHGIMTILDPKRPTYKNLKGLSIVKPNTVEIKATGKTPVELSENMGNTYLIHTKGADGMDCYQNGQLLTSIHAHEVEVSDVCGAGDTITSVLALGIRNRTILNNINIRAIMSMASFAASRTVTHRGSYVLSKAEIESLLNLNW